MNRQTTRATAMIAALTLSAGAMAASRAYVVQGHDGTWRGDWNLGALAGTAQDQVLGKGYTLVRQNSPTRQNVLNTLNTANQTVFFFGGHGIKRQNGTFAAQIKVGDGEYVSAQDVIDNVPLAVRQQYTHVVFQACGQLRNEWTQAFPNATIWGHNGSVTMGGTRFDQYWRGEDRMPAKAGVGAGAGAGLNVALALDARIEAAVPLTYNAAVDGFTNEGAGNFARYAWAMSEPIATDFGAQRFNMVVGDSPGDMLGLCGVFAADGKATGTRRPFSSPDFTLGFTFGGLEAAFANIDNLPSLFSSGQAWIADNFTGVSDDTLFFGAVAITFGYNAVPAPGGAALAGVALLVAVKRRRER